MASTAVERLGTSGAGRRMCRVLGVIGEPMNGVSYVRFFQPFDYLRADGFELRTLGESLSLRRGPRGYEVDGALLDGVAILIFPQMVASPTLSDGGRVNVVGPLCEEARRRGVKIVYSVDDYLPGIEKQNPGYEVFRRCAENLDTILDHCDAIIASTAPFRDSFSALGKPVYLLPNSVEPARWHERPRMSGELRVGWAGSSSHLDDLLMVVPAIRRLQQRIQCRLALLGLSDLPLGAQVEQIRIHRKNFSEAQTERAERFLELVGQLRCLDYEHIPFCRTDRFFGLLPSLDLDIGICPLLDTPFNRHKSANKFYEYAVTGSMTVASHVGPYIGEVSVTVPNEPALWCETLEHYLRNPAERERELDRQREFVMQERNIETFKDRWAACLREILGEATMPARPATVGS
jgi:glycosyltransferase involved in cell wall biosynthesis